MIQRKAAFSPSLRISLLFFWIILMSIFFAMTEIQIEGANGWASSLPTWRIEQHPLLDLFWGGRPMTGYHAWVFSFMLISFHFPLFISGKFSWRLEMRCLGSLMFFWIIEDLFWFVLNPSFGFSRLVPDHVPWHKHWLLGLPNDYFIFGIVGIALILISFRQKRSTPAVID